MGYFEIKLYKETENRFNITTKYHFTENWKRFIDDCEILFNADKIKVISLLEILNSVNQALQLTKEFSENNLTFLDITIHKDGNKI